MYVRFNMSLPFLPQRRVKLQLTVLQNGSVRFRFDTSTHDIRNHHVFGIGKWIFWKFIGQWGAGMFFHHCIFNVGEIFTATWFWSCQCLDDDTIRWITVVLVGQRSIGETVRLRRLNAFFVGVAIDSGGMENRSDFETKTRQVTITDDGLEGQSKDEELKQDHGNWISGIIIAGFSGRLIVFSLTFTVIPLRASRRPAI